MRTIKVVPKELPRQVYMVVDNAKDWAVAIYIVLWAPLILHLKANTTGAWGIIAFFVALKFAFEGAADLITSFLIETRPGFNRRALFLQGLLAHSAMYVLLIVLVKYALALPTDQGLGKSGGVLALLLISAELLYAYGYAAISGSLEAWTIASESSLRDKLIGNACEAHSFPLSAEEYISWLRDPRASQEGRPEPAGFAELKAALLEINGYSWFAQRPFFKRVNVYKRAGMAIAALGAAGVLYLLIVPPNGQVMTREALLNAAAWVWLACALFASFAAYLAAKRSITYDAKPLPQCQEFAQATKLGSGAAIRVLFAEFQKDLKSRGFLIYGALYILSTALTFNWAAYLTNFDQPIIERLQFFLPALFMWCGVIGAFIAARPLKKENSASVAGQRQEPAELASAATASPGSQPNTAEQPSKEERTGELVKNRLLIYTALYVLLFAGASLSLLAGQSLTLLTIGCMLFCSTRVVRFYIEPFIRKLINEDIGGENIHAAMLSIRSSIPNLIGGALMLGVSAAAQYWPVRISWPITLDSSSALGHDLFVLLVISLLVAAWILISTLVLKLTVRREETAPETSESA